jgi:energy-coupling factor transport system ATP-binding protein
MPEKIPVIEFSQFSFKYDAQQEPSLHDINLTVYQGEKILIAGPSGCGKSTLAHCINGLIPFSFQGQISGSLKINNKETKEQSIFDISKKVGTVLQDSDGQFIGLTVAEDIAFSLENNCTSLDTMKNTVQKIADVVGVGNHLQYAPHELSGGQKQRVSLGGVLVDDVDILLFDEPLANLDPATGKQAIELIDTVANDRSREIPHTVIIIEHRIEDVLHRPIHRIILMNEGRIIADLPPAQLLCSSLLLENGIREPLYITALKYAGIPLTPQMHPEHIDSVILSSQDKDALQNWVDKVPLRKEKEKTDWVLNLENIFFTYSGTKRKAVEDVSLTVEKGSLVSFVGKNGAGKSTLSKLICGFQKPDKGRILFSGSNLSSPIDLANWSIKEHSDKIGYVMQNPNQMLCKTGIFEEVALALQTRREQFGLLGPEGDKIIKEKVEQTLRICGLYPFRKWPISALSYGQKKRVTIASLLVLEPEILILDEPTAGQDLAHYTEIMDFLEQLTRKGITIILITHDMHLLLEYAEKAFVFSQGKLITSGTGPDILTNSEITTQANLKETSLYTLAKIAELQNPHDFVSIFIDFERQTRDKSI